MTIRLGTDPLSRDPWNGFSLIMMRVCYGSTGRGTRMGHASGTRNRHGGATRGRVCWRWNAFRVRHEFRQVIGAFAAGRAFGIAVDHRFGFFVMRSTDEKR
eukprot:3946913-Prymnesium_polylepis.2